ncbi:MAG TPA: hypothetical protein VLE89_03055 [Chlamydiales bacterium]|nr:hypothetical protein [Chlamydiales bacterium]
MSTDLIETLKETLSDPAQLTPEKLKVLINETLKFFQDLQGKFDSKDPKQREEAFISAGDLKQALEIQMESLMKLTGLDPAQMAALVETVQYSTEEKEAIDSVKSRMQEFQSHAKAKQASSKTKAPKIRLMG